MKSLKMEASLTGAYAPLPTPAARRSHNRRWGGLDPCTSSQSMDPTAPPFIPRQSVASAGLAYQTHMVEDFARYLARCELVSTGLNSTTVQRVTGHMAVIIHDRNHGPGPLRQRSA